MALRKTTLVAGLLSAALGFSGSLVADAKVDPAIADYSRVSGVSGNLSSVGSDTLANLMTLWAEDSSANTRTSISRFRPPAHPRRRRH